MKTLGDECDDCSSRSPVETRIAALGWPAEVAGIPIGAGGCGQLTLEQYYTDEVVTLSQGTGAGMFVRHAAAASNPADPTHFEYQLRKILKELTCCRGDFDGDGEHTFNDFLVFSDLHGMEHPAADLDCDGYWTESDANLMQTYLQEACPCGP